MNTSTTQGCGGGSCQCAGKTTGPIASINGIALHAPDDQPDAPTLQELAWTELLRQQAVKAGLLPRQNVLTAPALSADERTVIEDMLDAVVPTLQPTEDECQRYYDAHKAQFTVGQALHVRHILFAVTPGVNVHALTLRAESALLELSRKEVPPQRFEQLAQTLSNCPSGAQGGDLGWVARDECAPELANELFQQTDVRCGMGIHPRLIHTRFGFHIIEVLGRRKGKLLSFDEASKQVAGQLALQSRATALRHHMMTLVAAADVVGLELEGATSPLMQ